MAAISSILAALGLAASAAGSVMGGIQNKKNENSLLGQKSDLDTQYYQGALENVGAKAYLRRLEEINKDNIDSINNAAVSNGSTVENSLAQKQAANETMSNAIGSLLQQEEARRQGYFQQRAGIEGQLSANRAQRAQNWVTLAGNVANAAGNLGEAYLDYEKPQMVKPRIPEVYVPKPAAEEAMKNSIQSGLDASIEKQIKEQMAASNKAVKFGQRGAN